VIRLGKLTDYGLLLMCQIARRPVSEWHTARGLAVDCRLPLPTVSKILKTLLQSGLLESQRGMKGGYILARDPSLIPITEIISALEGPFALTECVWTLPESATSNLHVPSGTTNESSAKSFAGHSKEFCCLT
jgi:Rrf2 family protein